MIGDRFLLASVLAVLVAWVLPAGAGWSAEQDAGEVSGGEVNNGQDLTRPVARFDIRYQYENVSTGDDRDDNHIFTLRCDRPFTISPRWKFNTRMDVPLLVSNVRAADNPNGAYRFGLGDVLVQGSLINVVNERFAWAVGAQLVMPTDTRDNTGSGRWQIVPLVAARVATDNILKGSWFALAARWAKDFASARGTSTPTNELQFAPVINIPLRNNWFIDLFPSTDIRYNLGEKRLRDTGRWFIPANFLIGKMVRKNVITSLEIGIPIVKQYKVYDFKSEFRVGIFF